MIFRSRLEIQRIIDEFKDVVSMSEWVYREEIEDILFEYLKHKYHREDIGGTIGYNIVEVEEGPIHKFFKVTYPKMEVKKDGERIDVENVEVFLVFKKLGGARVIYLPNGNALIKNYNFIKGKREILEADLDSLVRDNLNIEALADALWSDFGFSRE